MRVQTYLSFDGRCQEALEFYRDALNAKIGQVVRVRDIPQGPPGADANHVVYAQLQVGETTLLAMDGGCAGQSAFAGFSLSLIAATDEETERLFGRLAEGGAVRAALAPTFFSSRYGMVADRFGVNWMVLTASAATAHAAA